MMSAVQVNTAQLSDLAGSHARQHRDQIPPIEVVLHKVLSCRPNAMVSITSREQRQADELQQFLVVRGVSDQRLLARLSAERASPEQRKEFANIGSNLRQLTEDTDETIFSRWDNRLTELEYEAAQNEFASKSMALLHGLSMRFWVKYHRRHASLVDTAVLHANLAEQICRGNAKSAAAASDKLLDYIEEFTRNTIV